MASGKPSRSAIAGLLALTACDPRCAGLGGRGDSREIALASLMLSDPARAVADARRMIEEERASPGRHGCQIAPDKLPDSLRWPAAPPDPRDPVRPLWACVEKDHVDLVVFQNADGPRGFRIWSADGKRAHKDGPTRYADVFLYEYDNNFPESPSNIR